MKSIPIKDVGLILFTTCTVTQTWYCVVRRINTRLIADSLVLFFPPSLCAERLTYRRHNSYASMQWLKHHETFIEMTSAFHLFRCTIRRWVVCSYRKSVRDENQHDYIKIQLCTRQHGHVGNKAAEYREVSDAKNRSDTLPFCVARPEDV